MPSKVKACKAFPVWVTFTCRPILSKYSTTSNHSAMSVIFPFLFAPAIFDLPRLPVRLLEHHGSLILYRMVVLPYRLEGDAQGMGAFEVREEIHHYGLARHRMVGLRVRAAAPKVGDLPQIVAECGDEHHRHIGDGFLSVPVVEDLHGDPGRPERVVPEGYLARTSAILGASSLSVS